MSKSQFNFNEKALREITESATENLAVEYQKVLDRLYAEHKGRDVEEIKPALAAAWKPVNNGSITDQTLTEWATVISNGTKIVFKPGKA